MKKLYFCLIFFLLASSTSSFAQRIKYEVKLVLDGVKNVKGTLQKVSADGVSIADYRGRSYFFTPQAINKIKVRRKGLTFVESVETGTGIGVVTGATIILLAHSGSDLAVTLAVGLVAVGAVGGALGGLVGETLNTELVLVIQKNPTTYVNEYLQLEKYLK